MQLFFNCHSSFLFIPSFGTEYPVCQKTSPNHYLLYNLKQFFSWFGLFSLGPVLAHPTSSALNYIQFVLNPWLIFIRSVFSISGLGIIIFCVHIIYWYCLWTLDVISTKKTVETVLVMSLTLDKHREDSFVTVLSCQVHEHGMLLHSWTHFLISFHDVIVLK